MPTITTPRTDVDEILDLLAPVASTPALDQLQADYADALRYEQRAEHFLLEANKRTAEAAAAVEAYIAAVKPA